MLKRLGRLLVASAMLAIGGPLFAQATTLGNMAAQMVPGEWRTLSRAGDGSGYGYELLVSCKESGGDCADNILNYADKALWNANTREIHFIGKGHMRAARHIVYSEATNRWSVEPLPSWAGGAYGIGHGYEHSAIDPANGNIYLRQFNSTAVYRWSRSTKAWTQLPAGPNTAVVAAIEYFPEMGGLVYVGGGEVHFYSESQGRWSLLASGLAMGPYSHVVSYNPVHKVIIAGGGDGSNQLYRVNASGTVTPIASAPVVVGIQSSVFTVDPASAKYLLFGSGGGVFEYDVPGNRWTTLPSSNVQMFAPSGNRILYRSAVPISTHGVVAFLTTDVGPSNVFLYRHAPGQAAPPPDTTPPPAPTGLTVQ